MLSGQEHKSPATKQHLKIAALLLFLKTLKAQPGSGCKEVSAAGSIPFPLSQGYLQI
jgi:hypothetical protein